ncbi:MAG: YggS family pyridoxal phosphate-dependent enzyme [Candidatus Margulisbacteria bacterium]|nr:YggS family pyridoxal phosphate-dependent enzyme [Candidatus Margulisiibacteriota bacterium]
MSIRENLQVVRERIKQAAQSVRRDPQEIKLIAAVKALPTELVLEALEAGLTDIGYNKVQEAQAKQAAIRAKFPQVTWHMIGHLQRNKVRQALDNFDIIQTVDSERLAREIELRAQSTEYRTQVPILIEVNTSGEETKYGIPIDSTIDFLQKISKFGNIKVQGLMTIGLFTSDLEKVRPCFRQLRELSEKIKNLSLPNVEMKYLSMGMTDDFEVAIQEGSNMVRIGRAIFGQRR